MDKLISKGPERVKDVDDSLLKERCWKIQQTDRHTDFSYFTGSKALQKEIMFKVIQHVQ